MLSSSRLEIGKEGGQSGRKSWRYLLFPMTPWRTWKGRFGTDAGRKINYRNESGKSVGLKPKKVGHLLGLRTKVLGGREWGLLKVGEKKWARRKRI